MGGCALLLLRWKLRFHGCDSGDYLDLKSFSGFSFRLTKLAMYRQWKYMVNTQNKNRTDLWSWLQQNFFSCGGSSASFVPHQNLLRSSTNASTDEPINYSIEHTLSVKDHTRRKGFHSNGWYDLHPPQREIMTTLLCPPIEAAILRKRNFPVELEYNGSFVTG